MRRVFSFYSLILLFIVLSTSVYAQREDAVWARTTAEDITLDGVLNETSWAMAESIMVVYEQSSGLPTSGWVLEGGVVSDPINATVKFLAKDNQLYVAFYIPDSSVGGQRWNATSGWDGILGNVKNLNGAPRANAGGTNRPAAFFEWMISWLFTDSIPNPVGTGPRYLFNGKFADERTPEEKAKWDAGVLVQGTTNEDTSPDTAWIVEMKFNLDTLGYNTTSSEGDIVAINFSVWDVDWFTGIGTIPQSFARAHWQSPWGNNHLFNTGRVHVRPDVTTTSGPVPEIEPDAVYPNMANFDDPTIDGMLDEPAWAEAYTFNLGWDTDESIRSTHPGIGKFMSGQFQPSVTGQTQLAPVIDPSRAEVKVFFKGTDLYLGATVDDQVVKRATSVSMDHVDGINFIVNNKSRPLHNMHFNVNTSYIVYFDTLGNHSPRDFLKTAIDSGWAEYNVSLRGATTVNDSSDVDEGYVVEIKLDMLALGYGEDLDNRLLFMGVNLYDSDNFENPDNDYGTRSWWFKENNDLGPLPWGVLSDTPVGVDDIDLAIIPNEVKLYGNYPNPFNPVTKINYSIPSDGDVILTIYNMLGETVTSRLIPDQARGVQEFSFDARSLSSGIYFYTVKLNNKADGKIFESKAGKMVLMK